MKKIDFRKILQDRKTLILVLCVMIVSVFTLTIVYAALNAVLEINGNAEVVASNWDIHLENVEVKAGSSGTTPIILSSTSISFETVLNKPGDYYEFTVDVVNDGSIDAMIDSVVKTPELTPEQAKYIKYEITYENGEIISSNQNLKSGGFVRLKVKVEYRKDISELDLPASSTMLDLTFKVIYSQSDSTGNDVIDDGVLKVVNVISGDGSQIGDILQVGSEKFYVIENNGDYIKMLSEDSIEKSIFSETKYWEDTVEEGTYAYVYNEESSIYPIVQNYKKLLESFGLSVLEARLISYEELEKFGCDPYGSGSCHTGNEYDSWLWADVDAYFTGSVGIYRKGIFVVYWDEIYEGWELSNWGVRPVIIISASEL